MTAKKLPSGTWRVRVYSHQDSNGKQHFVSISAPTKQEAERLAAEYKNNANRKAKKDLTVGEAIEGYITAKEGVLSASTILGYRRMQKTRYADIEQKKVLRLENNDIQTFISDLSKKLSYKTVSNVHGLLMSSIGFFYPDKTFGRITLPQKTKRRKTAATDAQIMELFNHAVPELKKCIALAAFSSLRRGEICALKYGDIDGAHIYVRADMIKGVNGWEYKENPKTSDSVRLAPIPPEVVALLGTGSSDSYIIKWKPDTITKRFIDLRNDIGLPDIRFHDLRHYYASIAAALNIPDIYTESFGGWRQGSRVMKEVYQGRIDPLTQKYEAAITRHFGDMLGGT